MNPLSIGQALGAYAQPVAPPSLTSGGVAGALYGLPQNVQNYIATQPSYGEGDIQAPQQFDTIARADAQEGPQPLNPQPGDIRDLFQNQIIQRAPPNPIPPGPAIANAIRQGLFNKGDNI